MCRPNGRGVWGLAPPEKFSVLDCPNIRVVAKKVLENEKCSRSGKSQGISFSVREILKKNEKSQGKVREFQKFKKIAS